MQPDAELSQVEADQPAPTELDTQQSITWQAAENVDPYRPPVWYVFFIIAVLALLGLAIFLVKSITFSVLIVVMAVALLVYLRRPPQQLSYKLGSKGLHVNDKLYGFGDFRGFGVSTEDGRNTLILVPVKRFRPAVEAFFPTELGEDIVDTLAARLPMRKVKLDKLDKIAHKLRF